MPSYDRFLVYAATDRSLIMHGDLLEKALIRDVSFDATFEDDRVRGTPRPHTRSRPPRPRCHNHRASPPAAHARLAAILKDVARRPRDRVLGPPLPAASCSCELRVPIDAAAAGPACIALFMALNAEQRFFTLPFSFVPLCTSS